MSRNADSSRYADCETSVLATVPGTAVYAVRVTVLLWWLLPVVATLSAIALLAWREKAASRAPDEAARDASLRKMKRALLRPLPPGPPE